jgi:small subunit ribosomal protein S16
MLMVRLQRVGRKHEPVFRLVLTDSKNGPKSGKFLEILGSYDARRGEKAEFKTDRVKYWIANGAKLSDTVHNIFVERKIIEGKKINVLPRKTAIVAEKTEETKEAKTEAPTETVESKEETKTETGEMEKSTEEVVEEKV